MQLLALEEICDENNFSSITFSSSNTILSKSFGASLTKRVLFNFHSQAMQIPFKERYFSRGSEQCIRQ